MEERECGECTACCTILGVAELGKPFYSTCSHVCDKGCSIYADRPGDCRDYRCLWLAGLLPKHNCRPDVLGVMFDVEGHWKTGYELQVYEVVPGGSKNSQVEKLIARIDQKLNILRIVFYPYGTAVATDYRISQGYPDRGEYMKELDLVPVDEAGQRFQCIGTTDVLDNIKQ